MADATFGAGRLKNGGKDLKAPLYQDAWFEKQSDVDDEVNKYCEGQVKSKKQDDKTCSDFNAVKNNNGVKFGTDSLF